MASMEAMEMIKDLLSLGKASLEKRVREWASANLSLPDAQFDQLKLPALPARFDKVVKMDSASHAREKALCAIGVPLNYAVTGSQSVWPSWMSSLPDSRPKPPIYVPPTELARLKEVRAKAEKDQRVIHDPPQDSDP